MGVLETDIQFSDRAKGVGRSLRITTDSGLRATITSDADNPNTKILALENLTIGLIGGLLLYYFQNTSSDVPTYYSALNTPYVPPTSFTAITGVINGQVLYNFITESSSPGLTFIPAGLATNLTMTSEYTLTATTSTRNAMVQAFDSPAASNASSIVAVNMCMMEGHFTPTADGTFIARFASEVLSSAIVAKAGSICYYQQTN